MLVAAALRLQYITAPLLDAHRWRQVDTAAVARAFYEGPMNPLKPEANWGGAHGYVESEFPLLSLIVSLLYKAFGVSETWGRLVVVFFSLATVALVYVLARDLIDHPAGLAAAFLMAVSPGAVFYGRAFMQKKKRREACRPSRRVTQSSSRLIAVRARRVTLVVRARAVR